MRAELFVAAPLKWRDMEKNILTFPSFSDKICLVHLYVDILHCLIESILDWEGFATWALLSSPFKAELGLVNSTDVLAGKK